MTEQLQLHEIIDLFESYAVQVIRAKLHFPSSKISVPPQDFAAELGMELIFEDTPQDREDPHLYCIENVGKTAVHYLRCEGVAPFRGIIQKFEQHSQAYPFWITGASPGVGMVFVAEDKFTPRSYSLYYKRKPEPTLIR